jgi:hypothetical protein
MSKVKRILPVVEGDGDLLAVPALIRRVAQAHGEYVDVCRPHKRGELPKILSRFEDYWKTAMKEGCPILWVMDYDCQACTDQAYDVVRLHTRAQPLAQGRSFEFVFMVQEFETLFLADHETTRQVFPDIPETFQFPTNSEGVRDAKGWLSKARPKGAAYKPTQHQERLASQVDLARLRNRSPSFLRFERAVLKLLEAQA